MTKKFYEKTREERLDCLLDQALITVEEYQLLKENAPLSDEFADHLIENQVSQIHLPLGLAFNFVIDGEQRLIPMATEEPSVIAAASYAAKLIQNAGGFQTNCNERLMIGQIVFRATKHASQLMKQLSKEKAALFSVAEKSYPSIVKRGGGVKEVYFKQIENEIGEAFVTIELLIDVKDAMGANIINSILEGIASYLNENFPEEILMKILSNYADHSLVQARCKVKARDLARGSNFDGKVVAQKIVEATNYANLDIYRAATHNKGIMNGIDAVALATGNDVRAIEAGCHAYASRGGKYESLTKWTVDEAGDLIGELTLPLPVATVGGATSILPQVGFAQTISRSKEATSLAKIMVCVGLAQNLAALRALVSEGIQKGHMSLHAKTLAATVGATEAEVPELVKQMNQAKQMNQERAATLLAELRKKQK